MKQTPDAKLDVLKKTRKLASQLLYESLKELLPRKNVSEVDLRNLWLSKLRKQPALFPKGWYLPPPHGITVLFGTDKHTTRVSPDNYRKRRFWPRSNIYLNKDSGIAVLYISPVDKQTGTIGDFGLTLYFGSNPAFKEHLINTYKTIGKIYNYARLNMPLSELNDYTHQILGEQNLLTALSSSTDPQGTNTGHTIPATDIDWTPEERKILHKSSWSKRKDLISKRRIFVNRSQKYAIHKGLAFTIEPRPYSKEDRALPSVLFHTICIFRENGVKELLLDFDRIFKLVHMDYMPLL